MGTGNLPDNVNEVPQGAGGEKPIAKCYTFFDSLSLSGSVILMFVMLTVIGIAMDWRGHPNGEKVWNTFATALTTFVSGKYVGKKDL